MVRLQTSLLTLFLVPAFADASRAQGLGPPAAPPENPTTVEKALLGQALFWDEQLSSTRTVSCGTCHQPGSGGADPRSGPAHGSSRHPGPDLILYTDDDLFGSPGVTYSLADGSYGDAPGYGFGLQPQVTPRHGTSVIMAAFAEELRWDGIVDGEFLDPATGLVAIPAGAALESQALRPLFSFFEMGHAGRTPAELEQRVKSIYPLALAGDVPGHLETWIDGRDYRALFENAFGSQGVTSVRIAMALAAYQRTLVPDQAPIDAFLAGDSLALSPEEQAGYAVFQSVGCVQCHPAPTFTDQDYHYLGVRPPGDDRGRFYKTLDFSDLGSMRTPSLRNVELRAAYFHNGTHGSLAEVVDFFDRGGDFDADHKSPLMVPLGLTAAQRANLLAFLGRPLTDPRVAAAQVPFDRPSLYSNSSHVPELMGAGKPGTGGTVPAMIALEPPHVLNPRLTLGVEAGAPHLSGFLLLGLPPTGGSALDRQAVGMLPVVLTAAYSGGGFGSVTLDFPPSASLAGTWIDATWVLSDPGAAGGKALSPTARLTWF